MYKCTESKFIRKRDDPLSLSRTLLPYLPSPSHPRCTRSLPLALSLSRLVIDLLSNAVSVLPRHGGPRFPLRIKISRRNIPSLAKRPHPLSRELDERFKSLRARERLRWITVCLHLPSTFSRHCVSGRIRVAEFSARKNYIQHKKPLKFKSFSNQNFFMQPIKHCNKNSILITIR